MTEPTYSQLIAQEIAETVELINDQQLQALIDEIVDARRVFVCGTGRSLLMMKALAMRLMHVSVAVYVVGETVTPAIQAGDLLIAGSGSGRTRTTLTYLQAGKAEGARTAAITAYPNSPIGNAADVVVEIPVPLTGRARPQQSDQQSIQPPGSLFEQCLLVVADAIVLAVMKRRGTTIEEMRSRHTKLE